MKSEYSKHFRFGKNYYTYVTVRRNFSITCDGVDLDCRNGKCEHIKKVLRKIHPIYKRGIK